MLFQLLNIGLLAGSTLAAALPSTTPSTNLHSRALNAADILLQLAPGSSACSKTEFPAECATAAQAAPYLIKAFQDYQIFRPSEMVAILSTIAFESGNFQYNQHHYPTHNPGQGTRNMQSKAFNFKYASSIPALKDQIATIGGSAASMTDVQADKILALVMPDEYTWASGVWFYSTQCSDTVKAGVQAGTQDGWAAYLKQCVQTSVTTERISGWKLANAAFGIV